MITPARWPLLIIGASAGAATWSGWVGLGGLTGFGIVKPLPGIFDSFAINTAITLPIGVEAYAVYALAVATSTKELTGRARRYAAWSAAGALILGMLGQAAFHLMAAAGWSVAPWWVVVLVSCMPVAVLGAASYLWHLASVGSPDDRVASGDRVGSPEAIEATHPTESPDRVDPTESPDPTEATESPDRVGSPSVAQSPAVPVAHHPTESPEATGSVVQLRSRTRPASRTQGADAPKIDKLAGYVERIKEAAERGKIDYPIKTAQVMSELSIGASYARPAVRQIKDEGWQPRNVSQSQSEAAQ